MSMRNYGFYYQGALIHDEDFDACKVILGFADALNLRLSGETKSKLERKIEDEQSASELFSVFDVDPYDVEAGQTYAGLMEVLMDCKIDVFDSDEPRLLGNDMVSADHLTDIEADFYYADVGLGSEFVDNCDILHFCTPIVWEDTSVNLPKNRQEAIEQLKDAGKLLLKDDIDWEARLGQLIGSMYG